MSGQAKPGSKTVLRLDPAWAWAPFLFGPDRPWDRAMAAHLYARAGLGASRAELARAVELGADRTVDLLLDTASDGVNVERVIEEGELATARAGDSTAYNAWWLRRLMVCRQALRERLTLFWHNVFAVAATDVGDLGWFHQHICRLRTHALEGVSVVFGEMLRDPTLFAAFDGAQNRRARPNLGFAEVWLKQFSVGPELCDAPTIAAVARSFTGWFVYGGKLRWIEREHDRGEKTLFGETGRWDVDSLARILPGHPRTLERMADRMFRGFVAEGVKPSTELLQPLVTLLQSAADMRPCLRTLLRSNLFFSRHALGQKVKSPLDLVVGLARASEMVPPTLQLGRDLANQGQRLDRPPTVSGWRGGTSWIHAMSLAARQRTCRALIEGGKDYGSGVNWSKWKGESRGQGVETALQELLGVLLPQGLALSASQQQQLIRSVVSEASDASGALARLARAVINRPEYQLC